MNKEIIVAQTKKWIVDVVIGCNFCPFAYREVKRDSISFEVITGNKAAVSKALSAAFAKMKGQDAIETMFLVLPQNFSRFSDFLKLVQATEVQINKEGHSGIFQVATFHPSYFFAGSSMNDAANYTNRSPYPMLQILREESVSRAVDSHPDVKAIPVANTAFARGKGITYMQSLLAACMDV